MRTKNQLPKLAIMLNDKFIGYADSYKISKNKEALRQLYIKGFEENEIYQIIKR